jgi:aminocarboxymuconate-semialdehyde decarboxylase
VSRPIPTDLADLQKRELEMDRTGVGRQVLSGWTEVLAYDQDSGVAANFARRHNEALAAAVGERTGRFIGLGTVPLQDPNAAAAVLAEAMQDYGLAGVQLGTHVNGTNLGEPRFEPFWSAAEALKAFVLIHPAQSNVAGKERMPRHYFENLLGNPFDTTLAGASLIFDGVLERHPGLRICLAHGGGFLPFQLGRLVRGAAVRPEIAEGLTKGVEASFNLLHFDSILHDMTNLAHLISLVGSERVVLGSDYPFDMGDPNAVANVSGLPLSPEDRDQILRRNAERLLAG